MKRGKLLIAVLAFLVLPGTVYGQNFEISAGVWWVSPDGDLSFAPFSPSRPDLDNDLGFDSQLEVNFRFKTKFQESPNVYLKLTPIFFEETRSDTQPFAFGNSVFLGGSPLDSELQLYIYDAALFYRKPILTIGTTNSLNAEFGIDARFIISKVEISQSVIEDADSLSLTEESDRELAIFPLLYGGLDMRVRDKVSLQAELWGYTYRGEQILSIIGRAVATTADSLQFSAGYRLETLDFEEGTQKLDTTFSGPFTEVGIEF